ncbi:MAG: TrbC/VirB2 family protein [Sphingomonadales bacterium]|nr:TrbC/VirB2 family protein [Sphingomonadales bacterium]MBD3775093.1 TrbC/VirB2 family protein [Paracoccaceae bacterium]
MSLLAGAYKAGYAPNGAPALAEAVDWITETLLGSVATSLCVIAVATIGFMMVTGRMPVRQGLRIVLGCFVLLGAPVIAAALTGAGSEVSAPPPDPPPTPEDLRGDLPPADYDPYAGASLRRSG